MKNKFFSLVALLLTLFILAGCTQGITNDGPSKETEGTTEPTPTSDTALNGVDISKYTIVYSGNELDYNKRAAQYISDTVKEITSIELPVKKDSSEKAEYEIVVGQTNRAISEKLDADTEKTQFAILADDNSIALEADYFVIAAAAYFFVDTYITGEKFNSEVPKETKIHNPIVEETKNVIFLIGDGMGPYQTRLFETMTIPSENNYSDNEDIFYGYLLPYQCSANTASLSGVTDSAAAATALACGYKTINRYIGMDKDQNKVQSLTELAASLGKSTAVMSTEASTGATPGGFSAHVNDRGLSSMIKMDQRNLTLKHQTIVDCEYNFYTIDGVRQIESKVVSTLDKLDDNENGFFLMYEEAYIDKHSHANNIDETFKALIRFNQVIARFMEYAFYHPDTFVLITADHETGDLKPDKNGVFTYNSPNHSGANVPVFAYGKDAKVFNDKLIDNVQIPKTIASIFGTDDFGDPIRKPSLKK